jgi:hypothetical protein
MIDQFVNPWSDRIENGLEIKEVIVIHKEGEFGLVSPQIKLRH